MNLKVLRRILYFVVFIALIYSSWHAIQKVKAKSTLNHFENDLFITKTSPSKPTPFTLTDQNGHKVSLSDFKGKKLVIQPMDPKCTDICPLISQELIDANKELGATAKNVVYIAFNVNENHTSLSDVKAFSNKHGLSQLKNWYFLTGTPSQLKKIWKAYGISVIPSKTGDVQHTSILFFVDSKGQIQYEGQPQNSKATLLEWAHAIRYIVTTMN